MRRGLRTARWLQMRRQRRKRWLQRAYRAWERLPEEERAGWRNRFEEWVDQDADLADDIAEGSFYSDADVVDVEEDIIEELDHAALFTVFDAMKDEPKEFLSDGRPRVEDVVRRLKAMGLPGKVSRDVIDTTFKEWKERAKKLGI